MVTKIKGGNGPLFLLNMMCTPLFLPIIWIKFTKRLLSRKLNRINFPKALLTHELIRLNFFLKLSHKLIRINFPQKLLSHELIRIKLLKKIVESWADSTQLSKFPIWFESKKRWVEHKSERNQTWYSFPLINFTFVVKLLCRGHIRSGHQVESRDLTSKKVYARATATVLNRIFSSFQNLIRPLVPTTCISRIFYISMTWGQVKFLTSPL